MKTANEIETRVTELGNEIAKYELIGDQMGDRGELELGAQFHRKAADRRRERDALEAKLALMGR